uniref:Major facilitator transporter n=1 Tax=uncultured bacterium 12-5D TaxID=1497524 RepID=A0A059U0E7_9BACT|nr:major facilitator transporter [uncultured bacterium 12-5D]
MSGTVQRSSLGLFITLSVMMFMLFFVWGAWYVTMGTFMIARGLTDSIGSAYSVAPIAAIVTPFFMGVFADRLVNAEKLQGGLMILSAVAISAAPRFAAPETSRIYLGLLLAHTLCFMPNLALSNTVCLKHLADPDRDYPIVRVFATAGWIVAGLVVSFVFKAEKSPVQFYVAGAAALAVGVYSFFLPRTPPPARGKKVRLGELYGADTLPYFRHHSFAVFMFASLLVCVGMMPYWSLGSPFANSVGIERTGGFFTMGQIAELFVLALILPVFIKRFGIKWTMIVGMSCWVVRFLLFAAAATQTGAPMMTMMVMAVILHGFSYDFVFISGYLYVDRHVGEEVRAQAQGLLVVFTQGIGFLLSSQIFAGLLFNRIVGPTGGAEEWQRYWLIPFGYIAVILVLFWILFREDKTPPSGKILSAATMDPHETQP